MPRVAQSIIDKVLRRDRFQQPPNFLHQAFLQAFLQAPVYTGHPFLPAHQCADKIHFGRQLLRRQAILLFKFVGPCNRFNIKAATPAEDGNTAPGADIGTSSSLAEIPTM